MDPQTARSPSRANVKKTHFRSFRWVRHAPGGSDVTTRRPRQCKTAPV